MFDETRLRVFAAIAREGSVTGAAAALHYAQPSVSHHLARLEAEAGVALVRRSGRGIRLTDAGTALAARAEEILGRIDQARAELAAHAGLTRGRVRLPAFPSALAVLVPQAAARFGDRHPGVEAALVEAEPPEALAAVRRGEADAAVVFRHEDEPPPEGFHAVPLLEDPIHLVVPAADRDADGPRTGARPARLRDHADRRWITGCERCRAQLLRACAAEGFEPEVAYATDDYVAVQALVAAGLGVSTLPELALRAHHGDGLHTEPTGRVRLVEAVTFGAPPLPAPVEAFLEVLSEVAEAMGGRASGRRRHGRSSPGAAATGTVRGM
ncbi:LysR family transcriptional regulator [Nocardiopsis suaedae]|uniref:LysR family transcriptional regulator n=1 Tax=Nocardiopsis suaedae TaxID=3018444 RepID=A0ABT4TT94_9ACTN|nr:LysR family transcriptional regulator [Nocardiopsis suaedae]MDA2807902.1 LysR family transcriptional regulator [Nocardiopsis suaedae]